MPDQFATIDDYIRSFPDEVQTILEEVRQTIRTVAPTAQETMSYQMPTFMVDGDYLVHFAAWKHHLSVYPMPVDEAFERDIEPYRAAKSTVRFPFSSPIPYDLIARQVTLLVAQRTSPTG